MSFSVALSATSLVQCPANSEKTVTFFFFFFFFFFQFVAAWCPVMDFLKRAIGAWPALLPPIRSKRSRLNSHAVRAPL
ncbi:hypothetical protein IWX91DRAFT_303152, partial [Phyllosticta citricarpa]